MNENLGINMSSYLEWNILLAVLALFGNFPYGPPLSPNGIWDSFVSLSVSLAHQQHKVVYTGGNFLCNVCICKCVCGNWGLAKSLTVCGTQARAQTESGYTRSPRTPSHARWCSKRSSVVFSLRNKWTVIPHVNVRGTYVCRTSDNVFQSNPSHILHHKGFAALQRES